MAENKKDASPGTGLVESWAFGSVFEHDGIRFISSYGGIAVIFHDEVDFHKFQEKGIEWLREVRRNESYQTDAEIIYRHGFKDWINLCCDRHNGFPEHEDIERIKSNPYLTDKDKLDFDVWHENLYVTYRQPRPKPKRKPVKGYIYLLSTSEGHYKIGKTKDPQSRITTFHIKLPFPVNLEHCFPSDDYTQAELSLHKQYRHQRVNGEWFALESHEIDAIKAITASRLIDDELVFETEEVN